MQTLTFQNITLTPAKVDNQIWLTSGELAKALDYASTQSVTKIYERNADEFTSSMTTIAEVKTNGGIQKMRIFSLRGCHLIAMFARTKVAKEFRGWVLDILDKEVGQPVQVSPKLSDSQCHQIQKAVRQKCKDNSTHYQTIYTALKDKFKVPSYKDILASEFEQALAFIVGFDFTDNDHNAFWRMVGLLEHARISDEIDRLNDTINQAERFINQARRQITHLNKTTGLLYDAFGEQRLPTKADVVSEAKVFIAKQMAFKRQIGMI